MKDEGGKMKDERGKRKDEGVSFPKNRPFKS
jgi:hypothetical protein